MAKILIAEDEPDIQALLALILRHSGHEVIAAGDGQAALDLQPHGDCRRMPTARRKTGEKAVFRASSSR